jgi:hypothetical protein
MPQQREINETQAHLLNELEELVSLLAQQTDSKTTNLRVHIEEQKKRVDEEAKRRWRWFLVITSSVLLVVVIAVFEMWERQYDRINTVEKQVIKVDTDLNMFKERVVKKSELIDKLDDFRQKRDMERDKRDKELEVLIRQTEKNLENHVRESHSPRSTK